MSTTTTDAAAQAAIGAATRELHLPTVRAEAARLAEMAQRSRLSHLGYLAEVLSAEATSGPSAVAPAASARRTFPG